MACNKCVFGISQMKKSWVVPFNQGMTNFSTSAVACKKTPHTIGVMSWVRSAYRRKYLEKKMKDHVKSELQVTKEQQLNQMKPKIEFQTTSRNKERFLFSEENMNALLVKPTVVLSSDQKTIICYHPPPKSFPESYTKRAVGQKLFGLNKDLLNSFKDNLSLEEVDEARKLREENPRLWNTDSIAVLLKTKPEVVLSLVPMTDGQHERANAEHDVFKLMSKMKRKNVRGLQQWERLKYIKSSRGNEFSKWFNSAYHLTASSPKAYVPPKF